MKNKQTLFEKTLEELKTEHKLIKPHTPKQNGRVERSHRKVFSMRPLGWLCPLDFYKSGKVKNKRYRH